MNRSFFGAIVFLLASAPMAQALVYDCAIKSFSPHGFIPPRVVVSFNEGDDRAIVVDSYIMKYNKTPLSAELKPRTIISYNIIEHNKTPLSAELKPRATNSYSLKWRLKGIQLSNENQRVQVLYSAILNTAKQTLSVSATLAGFDNGVMRGRGKCKVLKDK